MCRQHGIVTYLRSWKPVMLSKGVTANCSRIVEVTQPLLTVNAHNYTQNMSSSPMSPFDGLSKFTVYNLTITQ